LLGLLREVEKKEVKSTEGISPSKARERHH
jgi:hypothetical protein